MKHARYTTTIIVIVTHHILLLTTSYLLTVGALTVIDVHARDVIKKLVDDQVIDTTTIDR